MAAGMRSKQKPIIARQQFLKMRRAIEVKSKPWVEKHVKNRRRIVQRWQAKNKPKFKGEIKIGGPQIEIIIVITNSEQTLHPVYGGTIGLLWIWWEHTGTKKHIIEPRRPEGFLRFIPRGAITPVFTKLVRHPGTKPHKKTTGINRRLEAKIPQWLDPAVSEAFS